MRKIPPTELDALRYGGFLGHPYIVVTDGANERFPALMANDRGRAVASACGEFADRNPVVYERTRKRVGARSSGLVIVAQGPLDSTDVTEEDPLRGDVSTQQPTPSEELGTAKLGEEPGRTR